MKVQLLLLLIMCELLHGCTSFVIKDHLFGNYFLVAPDDGHQLGLAYYTPKDGDSYAAIISATVFAVGYNEKYLIAKQHPFIFSRPPNKDTTNYYILQITNDFNFRTMDGLFGPLTLDQFILKRHELGIPDSLIFTKEYEDLK